MELFNVFSSVTSNSASVVTNWCEAGFNNMPALFNEFDKVVVENASKFPLCVKVFTLVWVAHLAVLILPFLSALLLSFVKVLYYNALIIFLSIHIFGLLMLKFVNTLADVVKPSVSAFLRHSGTFVAVFLALVVYNNRENSMEAFLQYFGNLTN